MQVQESFLDSLITQSKDLDQLEKNLKQFEEKKNAFVEKLHGFRLITLVTFWLKKNHDQEELISNFELLIREKLIPGLNQKLEFFVRLKIIHLYENIRSLEKYSEIKKEQLCESLAKFLTFLQELFFGSVSFSPDPIHLLTKNKKVSHKQFLEFIESLSERDQLIARVLYYGEPTLEEALEITQDKILIKKSAIQFRKDAVPYPKHVIQRLRQMAQGKASKELVFTNHKGKQIERSHLNNCFERASQRSSIKDRITPRDLLESRLPICDSK